MALKFPVYPRGQIRPSISDQELLVKHKQPGERFYPAPSEGIRLKAYS
jgi:hypothetical protein